MPSLALEGEEDFFARLETYLAPAQVNQVRDAYALAYQAHYSQRRDNGEPYMVHPLAVARLLADLRLEATTLVVALLHDVVEDTPVSLEVIRERFGEKIAELVAGVTKLTKLELLSTSGKQAQNFRKLLLATARDIRVIIIKLADRLHNMMTLHCIESESRRQRISRETLEIYAPLAARLGMDYFKTELENLAFVHLYPEEAARIHERLNHFRGQDAPLIQEICEALRKVCGKNGISVVDLCGREKKPYSIYRKIQTRQMHFEQLGDIMGFRIIVSDVAECYRVLGAIHTAFPVLGDRFKDYISTPKANGYRALHTGVQFTGSVGAKIEIQIRTEEMEDQARNGVAAHWIYKEFPEKAPVSAEKDLGGAPASWLADLARMVQEVASPEAGLELTQIELYAGEVFCISPGGRIVALPNEASSVDFAYTIHSDIGDQCVAARVNGQYAPLSTKLQNGDRVEILRDPVSGPNRSWASFVKSAKARARLKKLISEEDERLELQKGEHFLEQAFQRIGMRFDRQEVSCHLRRFRVRSLTELYREVGRGRCDPFEAVRMLYPDLARDPLKGMDYSDILTGLPAAWGVTEA